MKLSNVKSQANDQTIVAGMVDGLISVRTREEDAKDMVGKSRRRYVSYGNAAENFRISNVMETKQQDTQEILAKYDACLRKFQYSKALDCVMLTYVANKTPHVTVALMQELIRREGLKRALAGRDGKFLVGIIRFLNKHIGSPRFGRILLHVANALLGMFARSPSENEFLGDDVSRLFTVDNI